MKKLFISVFIAAAALMMPANLTIAGDGVDENGKYPFYFETWNCDYTDYVVGEGIFHVVSDYDILKKGFKIRYHINATGTGVGIWMGDEYLWNDAINQVVVANDLPYTESFVQSFKLIGKGSAVNMVMHVVWKIMIDKDGNFKVLVDSYRLDCH
jgi:hypothetical protein